MKPETLKLTALVVVGIAAVVLLKKAVDKAVAAGKSVADAGNYVHDVIADSLKGAAVYAAETVAEGKTIIQSVKASADGAYLAATGQGITTAGDYVKALPSDKWDASTKTLIGDFNQARSRSRFNYAGWQVFDNGVIITPAGEYLKMDYSSAALDKANGYAVNQITGNDLFTSSYPTAAALAEELNPPGYSGNDATYP